MPRPPVSGECRYVTPRYLPPRLARYVSRNGLTTPLVHQVIATGALFRGSVAEKWARQLIRFYTRPPAGVPPPR